VGVDAAVGVVMEMESVESEDNRMMDDRLDGSIKKFCSTQVYNGHKEIYLLCVKVFKGDNPLNVFKILKV
jgi:hypothetical protein